MSLGVSCRRPSDMPLIRAATSGEFSKSRVRVVRIQSRGVSTDVAFGIGSAPTLVKDQASAILTGHVSAGWTIPADGYIDVWVPAKATHFAWISSATGGFVEFMLFETFAG